VGWLQLDSRSQALKGRCGDPDFVGWLAHDDKSIELREIETGLTNGDLVEVRTNLKVGETIVTRGSILLIEPQARYVGPSSSYRLPGRSDGDVRFKPEAL
jgi:hypothetical protein